MKRFQFINEGHSVAHSIFQIEFDLLRDVLLTNGKKKFLSPYGIYLNLVIFRRSVLLNFYWGTLVPLRKRRTFDED